VRQEGVGGRSHVSTIFFGSLNLAGCESMRRLVRRQSEIIVQICETVE
jgi:hypothetical protein